MRFVHMDIAHEYQRLLDLLLDEKPDSVVHFAEQRGAYSMKTAPQALHRRYQRQRHQPAGCHR